MHSGHEDDVKTVGLAGKRQRSIRFGRRTCFQFAPLEIHQTFSINLWGTTKHNSTQLDVLNRVVANSRFPKGNMSHRQNSRISPSSVHCSYRFWTVTLSFCRVCQLRMKKVIDSQGFGNLKDYRFWPVTISFCKVDVKPQNANWVQDYMAVRSLLPVAHIHANPKPH